MAVIVVASAPGSSSIAARPLSTRRPTTYRPGFCLGPACFSTTVSDSTVVPSLAAKASAAFVGLPSLNAAVSGGPMTSSSRSSCLVATPCTRTARRRGVPSARTSPCERRTRASSSATMRGRAASAASTKEEGSSSAPISSRRGREAMPGERLAQVPRMK